MVLSRRMSHGRTRRKFTPEQKLCIINEYSKAPLGMKSRILHKYGIKRHHIDAWKQQMGKPKRFPQGEKYPGRREVKSLLDAITPEAVAEIIPGIKPPKKKKKLNLVTIDLDTFKTLVSMGLPPLAALDGSKVN